MTAQVNSKMCIDFLAGGFKDFFNFHPYYLGKKMPFWSILTIFFQMDLFNHQPVFHVFQSFIIHPETGWKFHLVLMETDWTTAHRNLSPKEIAKKLYKWWKAMWPFFSPGFDIFWGGAHCYNAAWTWNFPWVSTSRFVSPALGLAVTHGRKMGKILLEIESG